MPDRMQWKKDAKGQYDPQVGAAAAANTALAERTQNWTEDYYAKVITPALEAMTKATGQNTEQQGKLFDLNFNEANLQDERYRKLGLPAEDRYYKMVDEYSSADEQERQAQRAIGDVRTAAAGAEATRRRKFQGLGIDPTSPAALSASTDMAVQSAAVEAAAATHAREAAKTLGMSLTADAANFGRGGASGVIGFGDAAGRNSSNAATVAQGSTGQATGAASPMQGAFGIAQRAYGSNLDAYTSLNKVSMEQQAAAQQGVGQLIGVLGSAAIKASDRRLKKHAKKIADLAHGVGLWAYRYIWEPDTAPIRHGVMADEIQKVFPEAVLVGPGGYLKVDYSKVAL